MSVPEACDVVATATIGDGQAGSTSGFLGREPLEGTQKGTTTTEFKFNVRDRTRALVLSTVAVDVRKETDRTSVVVEMVGGGKKTRITQAQAAPTGGVVSYITVVKFTE